MKRSRLLLERIKEHRRSRRVFLGFYSAIFKLMSVRFETFAYNSRTVWSSYAYNSRTVWSSYVKFLLQFEIINMHVCTNFETTGPGISRQLIT